MVSEDICVFLEDLKHLKISLNFCFHSMICIHILSGLCYQVTGPLYLQEGTKNLLSNLGIGRTHHFLIVHQFVLYEYFLLRELATDSRKEEWITVQRKSNVLASSMV